MLLKLLIVLTVWFLCSWQRVQDSSHSHSRHDKEGIAKEYRIVPALGKPDFSRNPQQAPLTSLGKLGNMSIFSAEQVVALSII